MPPLRTSKLQEKPSALKKELSAIQKIKFINLFLFWGGNFWPPGSGSTTLLKFRKYLNFSSIYCSVADPYPESGMENSRCGIRDQHSGSATLALL
jgi:hypothetical protein